jgi:hypothetical protein
VNEPNLTRELIGPALAEFPQCRTPARSAAEIAAGRGLKSAEAQAAVFAMVQPALPNRLGLDIAPAPASSITITTGTLVKKFRAELASENELEALREAVSAALVEQHESEQASISLRQEHLSQARRAVTLDPSPGNLTRLKELNTMTPEDFFALQAGHQRRRDVIAQTRISPLAAPIFEKVHQLLKAEADTLEAAEQNIWAHFDLPHQPSGLLTVLRGMAGENAGLAAAAARGLCDFRHTLLAELLKGETPPAQ